MASRHHGVLRVARREPDRDGPRATRCGARCWEALRRLCWRRLHFNCRFSSSSYLPGQAACVAVKPRKVPLIRARACVGCGSTSRSGRSRCPRRRRSSVLVKTHEKGRLPPPRPASSCARRCTTSGRGSTGRGRPSRRLPSVSRKHAAPESSSRSRSAGLCPSKPFVRQRGTPRRDGRARSVPCRRVGRGRSARRCVAKGIRPHRQGRSRSKCARAHGVDQRRNGRPPRRRPLAPRARPAGRRRRGRLLALVPERSEPPPSPNDMASRMERTFTATGACA